tara:strand:- start:217 stop:501 length:285 start_codon:yes stop_codon:yes gene_type:complete
MEIKTFEQDTIIFFDRSEFNLKGYRYYLFKNDGSYIQPILLSIYEKDLPKLKKAIGNDAYLFAVDDFNDKVIFSEEDFICAETFNPFQLNKENK